MNILVCGGRDYADYHKLSEILNELCIRYSTEWNLVDNWLPTDITIITGAARGADTLALDWAVVNYANWKSFPADWDTHGKKAGILRNIQMLEENEIDLVVAFKGGNGTRDMITRAKKAGLTVLEIK